MNFDDNSDSENERPDGHDEESVDIFDNQAAQNSFDDFMISLPKLVRKTLAVALMFYFQTRQLKSVKAAALEAAYITGFNEKTIRLYRNDYFENKGQFSETNSGKYKRTSLLNDENLRLEAAMHVRENAHKKGSPNMTAASFCAWVNNDLLPSTTLPPNYPRLISVRTATRWLHRLSYRPTSHKKEAYVDGHERQDVVAYRVKYLKELDNLRSSHLPPPPCSDERAATPPPDAETRKKLVLIYHDESIFNVNNGQTWVWGSEDQPFIKPKTKGAGIMVSDFIDQHNGFLRLTDEEHAQAVHSLDSSFPKSARVLLEYGADKGGYWTSEKFLSNVKDTVAIASFKYPSDKFTVCWFFDHSSCHKAFPNDALNVKKMNVHPDGAQAIMHTTTWAGRPQTIVYPDGTAKGMKAVLEERGINTQSMVAADMRALLSNHFDFQNEQTIIEKYLENEGYRVIFIPKFHCEFNPIERVWGQAKVYTRKYTTFKLAGLRQILNPGLDSVELDLIRKFFRRVLEYEKAYNEGKKAGSEVEKAVKVYKSHRRIFFEEN